MSRLKVKCKTLVSQRLRRLPATIQLRGRVFDKRQLQSIRAIVKKYWKEGRTSISIRVCRRLHWRQPNGWLKDRACRDVLRRLQTANLIRLPEPKVKLEKKEKSVPTIRMQQSPPPLVTNLIAPISLHLAKGNSNEDRWNEIVQAHHYLGHKVTVGKCLKFLVKSGNIEVGAVALSEPAWAVEVRDDAISNVGIVKNAVANNSRFLILPNVKVKNLASQILSLLAREGVAEWKRYYSLELECLETFVDSSRFQGTSYKAANWICVGQTKGFRKSGAQHFNSQTKKYVFLYPICSADRNILRNHLSPECENGIVKAERAR